MAASDERHTSRFQSTPPARGATTIPENTLHGHRISIHAPREGGDPAAGGGSGPGVNFNPRPPRGGRLRCKSALLCSVPFQSTPPARGATEQPKPAPAPTTFQSTPPARGATKRPNPLQTVRFISIHAPREGGDCGWYPWRRSPRDFNPRPPRGGRLLDMRQSDGPKRGFQSTPPARGATPNCTCYAWGRFWISIHAPREGGDDRPYPNVVL